MATPQGGYYPFGELQNFTAGGVSIDFTANASQMTDFPAAFTYEHASIAGSDQLIDRDGPGPAPLDGSVWTYDYHFFDNDLTTLADAAVFVETQFNLLMSLLRTINDDGSSGAVGILTVEAWVGGSATAQARIAHVKKKDYFGNFISVEIGFFIPDGGFDLS